LSRKSDDLAPRSRIARSANAGLSRRTYGLRSTLAIDEIIEVLIGEHAALAPASAADDDAAELSVAHVFAQGLDRAAQSRGGLLQSAELDHRRASVANSCCAQASTADGSK
jgi:hypothetical protein